jgi:uncharacterized protein
MIGILCLFPYPVQGDTITLVASDMTHKFPEIGARLNRAQGHLAAVIDMLESGRPCMDLAQQLHAVEKAIGNAKKELIKDHIHHCMEETSEALPREFRALIKEFQGVTKYL